MFTPSSHQLAIATHVLARIGNLIIRAVAGSGKTTTIVWIFKQLVEKFAGAQVLFLAFGKKIQMELEARGVPARTFNSLGFSALRHAYRVGKLDARKVSYHLRDTLPKQDADRYATAAGKLVDLAKNAGIGALVNDDEQHWFDLIDKHDVELEHDDATYPRLVEIAREALEWSSLPSTIAHVIDFNDQIYLPVKFGLRLPKFDFVLVDEAQDLNSIQRAILRKVLKDDATLVAVGDESQAIFGFRGADSDSMDLIEQEFSCTRLPLTVSYRCAKNIVKHAQQHGAIEFAPSAIDGVVRESNVKDSIADATAGDIFVCRTTKPLIEVAYSFLKQHKAAYVLGSEIGQGLVALVSKMKAKGIDQLISKLDTFTSREAEKAIAKGNDQKAEAIRDKTDCVLFLIDTLSENDRTIPALVRLIENLFADKANAVMLSTVHKAKGLEARRVFWLNYDKQSKWARQPWQQQQERNLQYVASTRAKEELVLLPEQAKREEPAKAAAPAVREAA